MAVIGAFLIFGGSWRGNPARKPLTGYPAGVFFRLQEENKRHEKRSKTAKKVLTLRGWY